MCFPTHRMSESLLTTVFSGPLHGIMRGLMENLLKTPAASQQERSFLYGSLLYYLVLCSRQGGEDGGRKKGNSEPVCKAHHTLGNICCSV